MAITPSTVTLDHKLYTTLSSVGSVSFSEPATTSYEISRSLVVINKPSWALITRNGSGNSATISKINAQADNLSVGIHSATVTLKLTIVSEDDSGSGTSSVTYTLGSFTLKINVIDTQLLTLTPQTAVFEYQLGGAQPAQQLINVLSESNWTVTKTKNWVTLPTTTGSNNGSFYIQVTPNGLAVGTHTDTITVQDDLRTETVAVSLVISEADTDTTFLYVSPSTYTLNYTIGGYLPIKIIEYNASGNWTASGSESWVGLSATSGGSGVGTVELTLQNTSGLTQGTYSAEVTFTLGGLVKKVYLTLNVFEFIIDLLDPNELYFTKDNNLIELSSQQIETHLALHMSTNYEGQSHVVNYVLPFFNGSATRRIGEFPHAIIGSRPMLENIHAIGLFYPYDPVALNVTLTEEDLLSDIVYQIVPVNGIQFLKGRKPVDNWLTDMPNTRYLTKKGILTFSFLSNGQTAEHLIITGAVNQTLYFSNPLKPLYTAVIPLKEFSDLQVGDSFEVTVNDNTIKVNIIPEGNDHCLAFWENENGVWDVLEFTGDIIETHKPKKVIVDVIKDHYYQEAKAISNTTTEQYKINTGWMYTPEDVLGLSKLLSATNVYLQFTDKIVKVNPTSSSLQVSKTNDTDISYDVTFENVLK